MARIRKRITSAGEYEKIGTLTQLLIGNRNGAATLENIWLFLKKLNRHSDPDIPLLDTYTREIKTYTHTKACTQMLKYL